MPKIYPQLLEQLSNAIFSKVKARALPKNNNNNSLSSPSCTAFSSSFFFILLLIFLTNLPALGYVPTD